MCLILPFLRPYSTQYCNMYGKQFVLIYYHVDPYVLDVLVKDSFSPSMVENAENESIDRI